MKIKILKKPTEKGNNTEIKKLIDTLQKRKIEFNKELDSDIMMLHNLRTDITHSSIFRLVSVKKCRLFIGIIKDRNLFPIRGN